MAMQRNRPTRQKPIAQSRRKRRFHRGPQRASLEWGRGVATKRFISASRNPLAKSATTKAHSPGQSVAAKQSEAASGTLGLEYHPPFLALKGQKRINLKDRVDFKVDRSTCGWRGERVDFRVDRGTCGRGDGVGGVSRAPIVTPAPRRRMAAGRMERNLLYFRHSPFIVVFSISSNLSLSIDIFVLDGWAYQGTTFEYNHYR